MGSSKGSSREVYDYLLSQDFGFCHGPVDSINQVFIKDKPIWCGKATENGVVVVNQPDLFGGDEGEGGPVGSIEVYLGGAAQVSSIELARRVERTSANMPGYRGLAHLFFRGSTQEEAGKHGYGFGKVALSYYTGLIGDLIQGIKSGFRFSSNNPYLPAVKTSVSFYPRQLGDDDAVITATGGVDENGDYVDYEIDNVSDVLTTFGFQPVNALDILTIGDPILAVPGGSKEPLGLTQAPSGATYTTPSPDAWANAQAGPALDTITVSPTGADDGGIIAATHLNNATFYRDFDVLDLGVTQEEIDAGLVTMVFPYATAQISGGVSCTQKLFGMAGTDALPDSTNPTEFASEGTTNGTDSTPIAQTISGVMPVGTRWVRFQCSMIDRGSINFDQARAEWYAIEPVHCAIDGGLEGLPDANPAHIIYEILVNPEWGMGEDPANIETQSFIDAAVTLKAEKFGLSIGWYRQTEIEKFQQEIIDHIQALLYQNPSTGKWKLRLLRDDYDVNTLDTLSPSNCTTRNRKTKLFGDTINEVVVTYTDPRTEEEATVTAHNLGNIAIQDGKVNSETRNYYAIRNPYLAQFVADRDVAASGYPLFGCQAFVDRSEWAIEPGDVKKFTWPEDGIADMVVRVMDVDYGSPKDKTITLSIVEEIFSVESTTFSSPQGSMWSSDRKLPTALDLEVPVTIPLPILVKNGTVIADLDSDYPASGVLFLLDEVGENKPIEVEVLAPVTKNNGTTVTEAITKVPISRSGVLATALTPEVQSVLPYALIEDLFFGQAEAGDLMMLGSADLGSELVMLDSFSTGDNEWTVTRAVYDTLPLAWPVDTVIWAFPEATLRFDPTTRAGGETIDYRFLPRTSEGRLASSSAAPVSFTVSERPHLPFRPGDCQLDGEAFGLLQTSPAPATVTATWVNRNRTTEDTTALKWDDTTATPEVGQTTTLKIYDDSDVFVDEVAGLTGVSHDIPIGTFAGTEEGTVRFVSVRDGLESLNSFAVSFDFSGEGYGRDYGENYGG